MPWQAKFTSVAAPERGWRPAKDVAQQLGASTTAGRTAPLLLALCRPQHSTCPLAALSHTHMNSTPLHRNSSSPHLLPSCHLRSPLRARGQPYEPPPARAAAAAPPRSGTCRAERSPWCPQLLLLRGSKPTGRAPAARQQGLRGWAGGARAERLLPLPPPLPPRAERLAAARVSSLILLQSCEGAAEGPRACNKPTENGPAPNRPRR